MIALFTLTENPHALAVPEEMPVVYSTADQLFVPFVGTVPVDPKHVLGVNVSPDVAFENASAISPAWPVAPVLALHDVVTDECGTQQTALDEAHVPLVAS
jgi:hypothetical protein